MTMCQWDDRVGKRAILVVFFLFTGAAAKEKKEEEGEIEVKVSATRTFKASVETDDAGD